MKKTLGSVLLILALLATSMTAMAATPYRDGIYEPETSLVMPATVSWVGDAGAKDIFAKDIRPATMALLVDENLAVTTRAGEPLWDSLEACLADATNVVPIFYLASEAAADAVLAFLDGKEIGDFFVAATPENAAWVGKIAFPLPHIFGLIDASDVETELSREEIADLFFTANKNGAPVVLLSEASATEYAVKRLQGLAIAVWAKVSDTPESILNILTTGANGVVAENPQSVYDMFAVLDAGSPVLLRRSGIAGHRGMPSVYIENTLRGAIGAIAAGADVVENDIDMSADGQLFIIHDDNLVRLLDRPEEEEMTSMTLAELQALPFVNDGPNGIQARNNQTAARSAYGYIDVDGTENLPSLAEFFETFKDTDMVHFVEIKSYDPAIVPVLRDLALEMGVADQMIVITFNVPILRAMYAEWPEMTVGCLGYDDTLARYAANNREFDYDLALPYANHAALVTDAEGKTGDALSALYDVIGIYNGRYNPSQSGISMEMINAGRHRGLTVWPWTYNTAAPFADAFLNAIYGITTNFTLWATDMTMSVKANDAQVAVGTTLTTNLFGVEVLNLLDEQKTIGSVEIVPVNAGDKLVLENNVWKAVAEGEVLVMLRAKGDVTIDATRYGDYYLYARPVTLTIVP